MFPVEVAGHGQDQVIGGITALPIFAHLLDMHIADALACTQHIVSQGMLTEIGLHQAAHGQVIGLVFRAGDFVDDDFFLRLKIALLQARIYHIAQQFESLVQVLAEDACEKDGGLVRGKGVEFRADFVEFQRDLLPVQVFRSFKYHVFEKMGDARDTGIGLVPRAGLDVIGDGYRFKIGHRLCKDLQTVRQAVSMKHSSIGCGFGHEVLLLYVRVLFWFSL